MQLLLILVTVLCVTGILLGRFLPGGRWLALVAGTVLICLASLMAWWYVVYVRIVTFDRILAAFSHEARHTVFAVLYIGPPLLPPAAFLLYYARRLRRCR